MKGYLIPNFIYFTFSITLNSTLYLLVHPPLVYPAIHLGNGGTLLRSVIDFAKVLVQFVCCYANSGELL